MTSPLFDLAARSVLGRYGLPAPLYLVGLGNRGGFSGARLWRVEGGAGPLCLRAWPPAVTDPDRLDRIHHLMRAARRAGLAFVPAVFSTADRRTWVELAGRLWDLTTWLPGRADFHDRPTPARLEAACTALARLHLAWAPVASARGPCPAVQRRLDCARDWAGLLGSGWRPDFPRGDPDPVHRWAERAWRLLQGRAEQVPARLSAWAGREFALQPCLCDVWHDHVLFEGESVTGLVDYGSIKIDHVTADLARLLGSLVPGDRGLVRAGLGAYGRLRPLTGEEEALVSALDETGNLLGAVNWLKWLYLEGRDFEDRAAVAGRLAAIVRRIENGPA